MEAVVAIASRQTAVQGCNVRVLQALRCRQDSADGGFGRVVAEALCRVFQGLLGFCGDDG